MRCRGNRKNEQPATTGKLGACEGGSSWAHWPLVKWDDQDIIPRFISGPAIGGIGINQPYGDSIERRTKRGCDRICGGSLPRLMEEDDHSAQVTGLTRGVRLSRKRRKAAGASSVNGSVPDDEGEHNCPGFILEGISNARAGTTHNKTVGKWWSYVSEFPAVSSVA